MLDNKIVLDYLSLYFTISLERKGLPTAYDSSIDLYGLAHKNVLFYCCAVA